MKKEIIILGVLVMSLLIAGCNNDNDVTGNVVGSTSDVVTIPLSDLSNEAKSYAFEDKGVKINYFVVLGSGGKPRTAFDACDVCGLQRI